MHPLRRFGWALVILWVVGGLTAPAGQAAEPDPISIDDWKTGEDRAAEGDAAIPADREGAVGSTDYPWAASLPALVTEDPATAEIAASPLPPVQEAATDANTTTEPVIEDAQDTTSDHASADEATEGEVGPAGVHEAASQDDSTGEIKAGQIRTPGGVINLQAITLDRLHEELEQQVQREDLSLSLQQCVALALEANRDIIVSSYEPLKSEQDIRQAKGEFDPVLRSIHSRAHSENTASSQTNAFTGGALGGGGGGGLLGNLGGGSLLGGNLLGSLTSLNLLSGLGGSSSSGGIDVGRILLSAALRLASSAQGILGRFLPTQETSYIIESDTWRSQTSVSGKIPWGTQYELSMEVSDEESTFNNFESEFSGGLTLTLTQPLLRGRGPRVNLARIRIAKNNRAVAENQLKIQVMNTLSEVVKAYWDLVGANQQLAVREKSLANADRLLDINERRMEIGTGAALEVVQAKASVAQRQGDVISARAQVRTSEDRLKLLLDMRDDRSFSQLKLVPVDAPYATELDLDESASVERALENRPEMHSAELDISSAELEKNRAANDMLPQLDVAGSVFQGARGGKASDVFDGVTNRNDNSWSLSVTGSVPIPNRAGRGAYEKAHLSKRQAEERFQKTVAELTLNVRNALRGLATSRILVESSKQARALQETNVMAEEKRLKLGVTTSFEVLRTQEDLATAEAQEVQALIDFEKAKADLELAEGRLLSSLGVEYDIPEPEKPVSFARSIVPPAPRD